MAPAFPDLEIPIRNNTSLPAHGISRVLLAFAGLLLFPAILWAHARLLRSEPADGSLLSAPPAAIRLEFSERPELALTTVRLVRAGDTLSLAPLSADSTTIVAPVPRDLASGAYTVLWRVAARDGHPLRGTITFTVSLPSDSVAPAPAQAPPLVEADEPSGSAALGGAIGSILIRWLGFASIFLLVGAGVFRTFVLGRIALPEDSFTHIASTNAATTGLVAAVGFIVASTLKIARESADMPDTAMSTMMLASTWGMSLLVGILAALAAAIAFKAAHGNNENTRKTAWKAAIAFSVVAAITPAFGGHAIAGSQAWLAVPADLVHVLTGSAWLGTLAVIVMVGVPASLKTPDAVRPGARVAAMINAFSPIALLCGGAVVATGLGSSVIRLGRVDALWTAPYGVALSLKLIFVAMLFAAGAWNWRMMKPRLTGDDAIAPLRSTASLELVLAGIVLGVTAVLVALELP